MKICLVLQSYKNCNSSFGMENCFSKKFDIIVVNQDFGESFDAKVLYMIWVSMYHTETEKKL